MIRSKQKRGVALLIVISALALVIVLFAAVATSVQSAHQQLHITAQSQIRAQQTAAVLARLGADASVTEMSNQKAGLGKQENPVDVRRRQPAEGDAVYAPATGLRHRSGDVVMSLFRPDIKRTDEYLLNVEGRRPGVVYLGQPGS